MEFVDQNNTLPIPFVLCDVFGEQPFAGNQLAVFPDGSTLLDGQMAAVAREFGWSEITFVLPGKVPRLRIWTPSGELPFAGHPTVGTAVVLALEEQLPTGPTVLELGIGAVEVDVTLTGPAAGEATMTQRAPEFEVVFEDRRLLAQVLGLLEEDLAPALPAQLISTGLPHFLVPIRSNAALARAQPRPDLFPALAMEIGVHWMYLFTVDTPESNRAARARLLGVGPEDPATGSAAGPLGAYLVRYGLHRAGEMEIEQGMEMGRPSLIRVDVPLIAGEIGAVKVSGQVHVWGRGELLPMHSTEPTK
ncbi:MAG: phenazine biosynthesis protein [Chloroflexi bacterium]|nr:MAG: phenazine biosynthesis protein [Chloroflexota bacterium]